ncbi:hypothetical protein LTS18_003542, partial [Coniosporium uncinatum]
MSHGSTGMWSATSFRKIDHQRIAEQHPGINEAQRARLWLGAAGRYKRYIDDGVARPAYMRRPWPEYPAGVPKKANNPRVVIPARTHKALSLRRTQSTARSSSGGVPVLTRSTSEETTTPSKPQSARTPAPQRFDEMSASFDEFDLDDETDVTSEKQLPQDAYRATLHSPTRVLSTNQVPSIDMRSPTPLSEDDLDPMSTSSTEHLSTEYQPSEFQPSDPVDPERSNRGRPARSPLGGIPKAPYSPAKKRRLVE